MLENITNYNRETYHEVVKPIFIKNKRMDAKTCIVITILSIALLLLAGGVVYGIGLIVFLLLAIVYTNITVRKKWEKKFLDRLMTIYHTDHYEMHMFFDQEKVMMKDDNYCFTYFYKDIKRRMETSKFLLLEFQGKIYLTIDKNGFVDGNMNDLLNLLSNTGVKI